MTGDNYNKKSGQAFLIIVMFVAVGITVVLATSFRTVTETQITKSQEESLKTIAAAEAGIEYGLIMDEDQTGQTYRELGLTTLNGIDLDKSTVTIDRDTSVGFVSQTLKKDNQYTFYWAPYADGDLGNSFPNNELRVFYGSNDGALCNEMALEFTVIYGPIANPSIQRLIADTGNILASNVDEVGARLSVARSIRGTKFLCRAILPNGNSGIPAQTKLIIIRYLTTGTQETRLGFLIPGGVELPPQGKIIRSEAVSTTGVKKIVESLQSYPQIPSEFFITQF